jgi:hypothetical protein
MVVAFAVMYTDAARVPAVRRLAARYTISLLMRTFLCDVHGMYGCKVHHTEDDTGPMDEVYQQYQGMGGAYSPGMSPGGCSLVMKPCTILILLMCLLSFSRPVLSLCARFLSTGKVLSGVN